MVTGWRGKDNGVVRSYVWQKTMNLKALISEELALSGIAKWSEQSRYDNFCH
jgi:hypothetical protein